MSKGKRLFLSGVVFLSALFVAALAGFGVGLMVWLAGFGGGWIALAMLLTWGGVRFTTLTLAHRWFETRNEGEA